MDVIKSPSEWMLERGISREQLLATSALPARVLDAILAGRYTPSPQQRHQLAAALGVAAEQVAWGHTLPIANLYGHGPQFGRSP